MSFLSHLQQFCTKCGFGKIFPSLSETITVLSEKCFIGTSLMAKFSVFYGKTSERHCTIAIITSASNKMRARLLLRNLHFLSSSKVIERFEMKKINWKLHCNNLSIHFWHIQVSECLRVPIDWFFVISRVHLLMSCLTPPSPFSRTHSKKKVSEPKLPRISSLKSLIDHHHNFRSFCIVRLTITFTVALFILPKILILEWFH